MNFWAIAAYGRAGQPSFAGSAVAKESPEESEGTYRRAGPCRPRSRRRSCRRPCSAGRQERVSRVRLHGEEGVTHLQHELHHGLRVRHGKG